MNVKRKDTSTLPLLNIRINFLAYRAIASGSLDKQIFQLLLKLLGFVAIN